MRSLPERIETDRLVLRRFTLDDVADVLAYAKEPRWARYIPVPQPYGRAEAEEFVARRIIDDWSVHPSWALELQGRVIGAASLTFEHEHLRAMLGYGIGTRWWGRGLVTEAGRVIIDAGFRHSPELRRIWAYADAENTGSTRVLERLGFTYEGTLRQHAVLRERSQDCAYYGLLRTHWAAQRRRSTLARP